MNLSIAPGLFRIILALAVCVSHLSRLDIGSVAVFIFFMLSGYWSTRMYQQKYTLLPQPKTTFWIARFLRIWILYVFCLIATVAFSALWTGTYEPEYWAGVPLLGVATHHKDILGVSWSLDLEVQFYLLVPAMVSIVMGRSVLGQKLFVVLLTACLTVLGWGLVQVGGLITVLAYLAPFMAGVLIYAWDIRAGWKAALWSAGSFLVLGTVLALIPATHGLLNKVVESPINTQWFGLLWIFLLVPFVAYNVRVKSSRFDRHLGNLSYSIYLVHFPFYKFATTALADPTAIEKLWLLGLTVPLALVPYLCIDRVIERHRENWSRLFADWIWRRRTPEQS